jgi:hypothetical protein
VPIGDPGVENSWLILDAPASRKPSEIKLVLFRLYHWRNRGVLIGGRGEDNVLEAQRGAAARPVVSFSFVDNACSVAPQATA